VAVCAYTRSSAAPPKLTSARNWLAARKNNPSDNFNVYAFPPIRKKPRMDGARYIQSTSATNTVNRFIKIAAAVPWKSGKRSLFSIFSMASFCHLLPSLDDALLHLYLESTHPVSFTVGRLHRWGTDKKLAWAGTPTLQPAGRPALRFHAPGNAGGRLEASSWGSRHFAGSSTRSLLFMKARRPPCERRLGSLIGGRLSSASKPRASRGLGLNLGGPP